MFCKFHISKPRVVEKKEVLSFAIMDDQMLKVGTVSFRVMQALAPDLMPEAAFRLHREKMRHAAYVASRKNRHSINVEVSLECFMATDTKPPAGKTAAATRASHATSRANPGDLASLVSELASDR